MTKPQTYENRGKSARVLEQPYLLLILAPLFWGGNVVAAKMVVGEIDPFLLLAARCVGATLFIYPFAWRFVAADWGVIRRTWPLVMGYGALGYALYNVLLYVGLTTTTAVNSSIETGALPMMILLANFIIFRVRASWLQILGVAIAISGVMLTATHGDPARLLTLDINIGDGFVLLACLTYTAYTLALRFRPQMHMMSFMAVAFTGAAITGLLLFTSKATSYVINPYFLWKLAMIALAGLNMMYFHFMTWRTVEHWDVDATMPPAVKVSAALSLIFWILVVFFGRAIGFTLGIFY